MSNAALINLLNENKSLRAEIGVLKDEIANLTLQVKELAHSLKTYIECAESCPVKTN